MHYWATFHLYSSFPISHSFQNTQMNTFICVFFSFPLKFQFKVLLNAPLPISMKSAPHQSVFLCFYHSICCLPSSYMFVHHIFSYFLYFRTCVISHSTVFLKVETMSDHVINTQATQVLEDILSYQGCWPILFYLFMTIVWEHPWWLRW